MSFVTPVVEHWLEREIAQWVHPMKDRSDDPSHHERTLLPRSYISLPLVMKTRKSPSQVQGMDSVGIIATPVVEHWLEQEIAQWVHPMKDRSDDPSHHERTLLPRSYISLPYYYRLCDVVGAAGIPEDVVRGEEGEVFGRLAAGVPHHAVQLQALAVRKVALRNADRSGQTKHNVISSLIN